MHAAGFVLTVLCLLLMDIRHLIHGCQFVLRRLLTHHFQNFQVDSVLTRAHSLLTFALLFWMPDGLIS